jgi:hypothetical protein
MTRDELLILWQEIRHVLHEAQGQIPVKYTPQFDRDDHPRFSDNPEGGLQEYEYWLAHNELELAWDALASVARTTDANAACWRHLAQAATLMKLPDKGIAARRLADTIARNVEP